MTIIKRIGPVSALKIGFTVYAFLGLLAGLFCSAFALAGIPFGPHAYVHLTGVLGLLPLVLCSLVWGIIGGLFTVLGAFIFNLASRWVGGLQVEIQ